MRTADHVDHRRIVRTNAGTKRRVAILALCAPGTLSRIERIGAGYTPAHAANQWVPDRLSDEAAAIGSGWSRGYVGPGRGAQSGGAAHRRTVDAATLLARSRCRAGQGRQELSVVRVVRARRPGRIQRRRPARRQARKRATAGRWLALHRAGHGATPEVERDDVRRV